jgi:hypothetical protein
MSRRIMRKHIWKDDRCAYCGLTRAQARGGGWLLTIPILAGRGWFKFKTLPPCPSYTADFKGKANA